MDVLPVEALVMTGLEVRFLLDPSGFARAG